MASSEALEETQLRWLYRWLVGRAELAELLHVNRETLGSWTERTRTTHCPLPVAELAMGPVWRGDEVISWWMDWEPKKGPNGHKLGYVDEDILNELGLGATNGDKAQD